MTIGPLPPTFVGPANAAGPRRPLPEPSQRVGLPGEGMCHALAGHNWYPTARRCGCGLPLLSAERWVEHVGRIADAG